MSSMDLSEVVAEQQKQIEQLQQLVTAGTARLGACERQIAALRTRLGNVERKCDLSPQEDLRR